MALFSRDQILDANDLKTKDIPVPEWQPAGAAETFYVRVRTLSGEEKDKFEASLIEMRKDGTVKRNVDNVRARLVVACVVNEAGENIFNNADVRLLGKKSSSALDRVAQAAQELNALSDDDISELAEGFGSGQSESSTTD